MHKTFFKQDLYPKKEKIQKPIAQIGKRTKERIALHGTESALHDAIWESRVHSCEICGKHIVERQILCFAHRLAKGQYKKYRYMDQNIALVCSISHHEAVDRLYQWKTEEIINRRNLLIKELDFILDNNLCK